MNESPLPPEETTMPPAPVPPPPRPRPAPRSAPPETLAAPGLAAYFRRHPVLVKRGAVGAITAGVSLFVIAATVTPFAAADVADPAPNTYQLVAPAFPSLSIDPAAPSVRKVLTRRPIHVKKTAPVTHGVISGLAANGIPSVALNAYRVAAARMGSAAPGCGIDWALLAGIGREESDHGRYGGAVLHADGVSTPTIIGPALDGVHWDYIPAPANGLALDGDAKYAHALGPMQFIPSTWGIYGTDANGDGKADIFNINDAALSAARYLCAAGGDLRSHAGQVRGVLAYNHSDEYLAQVLALADAYRRGVSISGIPRGITTGGLPAVTNTGYIPPANPGAPTAVGANKPKPKPKPTPTKSTTHPATSTAAGGSATKTSPASGGSNPPTSSSPPPSTSASPTPSPSKTLPKCDLAHLIIVNCNP